MKLVEQDSEARPEIPPSLDQKGRKKIIIPAEVTGVLRKRRTFIQLFLIIFFLFLPWLRIGGEQAFLLDISHRKFAFMGLHLFAHDVPLLFFVVAILVFGLVFITSIWGRVWCGWACPQTVFIDGVFRRIERMVEGGYLKRRAMSRPPYTLATMARKSLKWILFILCSSIVAHSLLAVFIGSESLLEMMFRDPRENWSYFILLSSATLILAFDFGWFREQFCVVVCPYGRFQSVLMDKNSFAVVYDVVRGEPRKGSPPMQSGDGKSRIGDCVNCRRCVESCPTGIDIRKGLQLDCIACTSCIDACDEIMTKLKKPRGLVRYANANGKNWTPFRAKPLFALSVILVSFAVLISRVLFRAPIDVAILRAHSELYRPIGVNGIYINTFQIHLRNQTEASVELRLSLQGAAGSIKGIFAQNPIALEKNGLGQNSFIVEFSTSDLKQGLAPAELLIYDDSTHRLLVRKSLTLIGPESK